MTEKDLPSELRQKAGREWSEEAAEDEKLTEVLRQRRLDLIAVAEDAAHRGDRATAEFDGKVLSGPIVTTGMDYVTLGLAEQEAEVVIEHAVWSFVSTEGPKSPSQKSGMRIRARLNEYADDATRIRLELAGGTALMGTIATVAEDHLRLKDADERDVYLAMGLLRAIIRSTSRH